MKDLASGVLVGNISNSATTMTVKVGSGDSLTTAAVWPSVPFYATIMPANPIAGASNSLDGEIVKVTNLTGGNGQVTMTISRGARGTTTKEFSDGAIVTNGIYAEDGVFLGGAASEVSNPEAWIDSTDIKSGAVKSHNIDWATLPSNYTTNEIDTGYKWIDGKPIYKTTVHIQDPAIDANKTYQQFTSGTVDTLVSISGTVGTMAGHRYPVPYYDSVSSYALIFLSNERNRLRGKFKPAGAELDTNSVYITVLYTKN